MSVQDVEPGAIVWCEESHGIAPALVVARKGQNVEALDGRGERRALALRRVLFASSRRLASEDHAGFARHVAAVEDLRAQVDLPTLWELVHDENPETGEELDLGALVELALSSSDAAAFDALRCALHEEPLYFRARKQGWSPASPRAVEEGQRQQARTREGEERQGRQAASVVATLEGREGERREEDFETACRLLEELVVHGDEAPQRPRGLALLAAITEREPREPERTAFELLVRLGRMDEDEDLNLRRYGVRAEFPPAVAAEAAVARCAAGARRDMTELLTLAIDDEGTTEVDDALALERLGEINRVHVFVADPAAFVPMGSALDDEARRRGSTLYHPVRRYPMLPETLGEDAASLVVGTERPALAFTTDFDREGRVVAFELSEATIRLDHQLTYDRVDALLEEEVPACEADVPVTELLHALLDVAEGERARRLRAGALVFDRTEVTLRVNENREVLLKRLDTSAASRRIVSEHMILACSQAAAFCRDQRIPAVYRRQAPPDEPLDWSPEMSADLSALDAALRQLKKAELSLHPHRHHSLGVEAYTQVTSPLRRYQDLVMHRQLKAHLEGRPCPHGDEDLMAIFAEVEQAGERHGRTESAARRYWLLRHLRQENVEEVEVVVRRAMGKRRLVQIEDYGLTATFSPRSEVAPGDRLRLRISAIDPRQDTLILSE